MIWLLLFNSLAFAQGAGQSCIQLENINIGCVSSIDHSCFINKAVDNPKAPCYYVSEPATMFRVEGPIAFHCKSSIQTETCTETGSNNDQQGRVCVTTSECLEYYAPTCNEECVPCFNQVVTVNNGLERGCIVCTRARCPDEHISTVCPTSYNGMPLGSGQRCSSDQRCPKTAVDPNGNVHNVTVNVGTCNPPQLPDVPSSLPPPTYCPWKVDKRTKTGCEPIEPDNQNP